MVLSPDKLYLLWIAMNHMLIDLFIVHPHSCWQSRSSQLNEAQTQKSTKAKLKQPYEYVTIQIPKTI